MAEIERLFGVVGKRVLITGGTSGIGLMLARGFADAGAEVVVVARNQGQVEETVAAFGGTCQADGIPADVTTEEGIATIERELDGQPLHILINNAGKNLETPLEGSVQSRDGFASVLGINLVAPFSLVGALLPNLRAAAQAEDPARIINISSVAQFGPSGTDNFAYSTSKSGLVMLTRHLAKKLGSDDITCNAIAPGLFPSRMSREFLGLGEGDAPPEALRSPIGGRMGRADDIVGAAIYLSSRAGSWVTGAMIPVTGGVGTAT